VNQRSLLVPKIHLQPKTIGAFNDRFDCGFFDSASVHVYAGALADLEFAFTLVLLAGHAEILHQPLSICRYSQTNIK
jgi:hypothetical protein